MQDSLFDMMDAHESEVGYEQKPELSQWFTPEWAAAMLVERYFPTLSPSDLVLELACGSGAFLKAIPDHVPAIGVEIDPELAQVARDTTGRQVITGDFNTVALPEGVTAIIGNPPYEFDLFDRFLRRSNRVLPEFSKAGFLIPAYFFQTFQNVLKWRENWSMQVDFVPRGLFPGIHFPLTFCVFRKDGRRDMVGFALYGELADVRNLAKRAQEVLRNGRSHKGVWRALVEDTLEMLGGKATLSAIYRAIEPRRPTETAFWREKVRQQLQTYFTHTGPGEYALAA
jgi:site-specific DNA-methyltransferase (adenine-specific)